MANNGEQAEQLAEEFLLKNGLTFLDRNYRCKQGEIDLVMRHNNCTVFVEVRLRSNPRFTSALESVTPAKQKKLWLAAQHFLQDFPKHTQTACRFDVVAFSDLKSPPEWIQAAFH